MKAEAMYVSSILLVAVILSLIAIAYIWGEPIIGRSKGVTSYEYSINKLSEIRRAISVISKTEGARYTIPVNLMNLKLSILEGSYVNASNESLYNSIDFTVDSPLSIPDDWILVDQGEDDFGILGNISTDKSGVIIARRRGEETVIRLWFRQLYDEETGEYYIINITRGENWESGGGRCKILLKNIGTRVEGNYTVTNIYATLK